MTVRIGLVAGPSSGKSTTAADVFVHCKRAGITVELVSEVAREEINKGWKIRSIAEQFLINQKQREKEDIIPTEISVMVTDSPAFLTYYYALWNAECPSDENMIMTWLYSDFLKDLRRYDKIYYLNRVKPYVKDGTRVQTEEESDQIGIHLKALLEMHHVDFEEIDGDELAVEKIMEYINYHSSSSVKKTYVTTIDATIDVSKSLNYYASDKTTSDTLCSKM